MECMLSQAVLSFLCAHSEKISHFRGLTPSAFTPAAYSIKSPRSRTGESCRLEMMTINYIERIGERRQKRQGTRSAFCEVLRFLIRTQAPAFVSPASVRTRTAMTSMTRETDRHEDEVHARDHMRTRRRQRRRGWCAVPLK